jgi:ABC-type transport system involved in multi-copper enzyme maturation permease subunit
MAGIIVITFSLGVGTICFLLIAARSPDIVFTGETCARIAGFEAASILYTSVFFLLGIVSSAALRTPAASLSLSLSVWLLLAVVWPPAANSIGRHIVPVKPLEQFIKEGGFQRFLSPDEVFALYGGFADSTIRKPPHIYGNGYFSYPGADAATMDYLYRYVYYADRVIRTRAEREWQLRAAYTAQLFHQESCVRMLSLPSPAFVFSQAATILSRTDAGAYRYHFDGVREYNRQFLQWLSDRNARHSRKWFVEKGALDLNGFPQFSNPGEPLPRSLYRAGLPLCILFLLNVLLLWCAHMVFVRKDIQ